MSDRTSMGADVRDMSLREVGEMFVHLGRRPGAARHESMFDSIADFTVKWVQGANAVSITMLRDGKFRTVAFTDERATRGDAIQYASGSGPYVDAILDPTAYHPEDLRRDYQ